MTLVREIEARGDDLAAAPVHHLGDLFGPFVHEQDQQQRGGMILGDRLRDRLQHHRLAGLGWRDDQGALAEAERADQIDHALDIGGARARRARRLERQRAVGMDGAQRREVRPPVQL